MNLLVSVLPASAFDRTETGVVVAVQWLKLAVELVGATIISLGILAAGTLLLRALLARRTADFTAIRLTLARYLALALEFQLGADILSTAIAPSWEQIGKLGAIAVIRTALNFFLSREMTQERSESQSETALVAQAKALPRQTDSGQGKKLDLPKAPMVELYKIIPYTCASIPTLLCTLSMKLSMRTITLVLAGQLTWQLAVAQSGQLAMQLPSQNSPGNQATPVSFSVSGQINNPDGAPLPGAVVAVRGKSALTTTNSTGAFLLPVEEASPVLVVSCQGYQTQMLAVLVRGGLNIKLYPIGVAPPIGETPAGTTVVPISNAGLVIADVQPAFTGGSVAYREYMHQNAKYPEKAKQAGLEGAVYVKFIVDERGHIQDAEVAKGVGNGFDEEALRLVRLMPWWTPGLLNGQPVKVACTLRIKFGLEQGQ